MWFETPSQFMQLLGIIYKYTYDYFTGSFQQLTDMFYCAYCVVTSHP